MVYTKNVLAKIGRLLLDSEPAIATTILQKIRPVSTKDISKIPQYFITYCSLIKAVPDDHKGPVLDRAKSEANKVFIAAMFVLYGNKYLVHKTISETLNKKRPKVSRQLSEVKFRYEKDIDFKLKVDNILKHFV